MRAIYGCIYVQATLSMCVWHYIYRLGLETKQTNGCGTATGANCRRDASGTFLRLGACPVRRRVRAEGGGPTSDVRDASAWENMKSRIEKASKTVYAGSSERPPAAGSSDPATATSAVTRGPGVVRCGMRVRGCSRVWWPCSRSRRGATSQAVGGGLHCRRYPAATIVAQ
jgi:hypothetical protein